MSLSTQPLPVMKVLDPRMDIKAEREYTAVKGASVNSWQPFPATNVNNSSFQITCNPPSQEIAISRLVFKHVVFNWSISGTNTSGGTLLNEGYIAPRCMPLTSVTQAEQLTINNDTISQAPVQQYWRALLHYRNELENRRELMNLAPSMLDQFQQYVDGVGTNRNPLGTYGDNVQEPTRASHPGFTIDAQTPGNTTATGTLEVWEPILVSPFVFGNKANHYSAFAGVQNMSYNATLGNLSRILSVVQGQGAGAGQIVLNEPVVNVVSAELLFNYLSPDPVMPVPKKMSNSYYSVVSYPTRGGVAVGPNDSTELTLQSIQVSSIPKRIYVFAKRDDSNETSQTSDTFLALPQNSRPLRLTWNNNQFLSQATTQDLYNLCVKNGSGQSYTQFQNFQGSVLAIDFGTDIGLNSNEAPGTIGNYQLGLTCNFVNKSADTFIPTLYCVVVYEGVFNIDNGSASHMIGVLSPQDVLNAPLAPSGSYRESQDVYGGRFEKLRGFLKKGLDYAKRHHLASKMLAQVPNAQAQKVSRALSEMGYGTSGGGISGGSLVGGSLEKKTDKHKNKTLDLSDLAK